MPAHSHEHADDGEVNRDAAATTAIGDAGHRNADGPGQKCHTEAEPCNDGGASEGLLLQESFQVPVNGESVSLDDVPREQRANRLGADSDPL